MIDLELNKQTFLDQVYKTNDIGVAGFMEWLKTTDFFSAPASSKVIFHGCYEGGLCEHTLNVMRLATGFYNVCKKIKPESMKDITMNNVIISAAFHDMVKVNYYVPQGKQYTVKEEGPRIGHGEKSIYVCMRHGLHLEPCEAEAIRWHMGAYDIGTRDYPGKIPFEQSFKDNPLARLLHLADQASLLLDN